MLHLLPSESFPHHQEYLLLSYLSLPENEYSFDTACEMWSVLILHEPFHTQKDLASRILPLSFLHQKIDFFEYVAQHYPDTPISMSLKMGILSEWEKDDRFLVILPQFARLLHFGAKPSDYISFLTHFFEHPKIPLDFFAQQVPLHAWTREFCQLLGIFTPTRPEPQALRRMLRCLPLDHIARNFNIEDLEEIYRQSPQREKESLLQEIKSCEKWSPFFRDEEAVFLRQRLSSFLLPPEKSSCRKSQDKDKDKDKDKDESREGKRVGGVSSSVRKI